MFTSEVMVRAWIFRKGDGVKFYIIAIVFIFAYSAQAEDKISDLSYLPSKGVFVGKTALTFINSDISGSISSVNLSVETEQTKITQTFAYGMTSWLIWSVTTPMLINGKLTERTGGFVVNSSLEAGLERSIFGLTAHHSANNNLTGIYTVQFREQGAFSAGTTALTYGLRYKSNLRSALFRVSFASFTESAALEKFRVYSGELTSQFENTAGFFIRPSLIISYESDTEFKNIDLTLSNEVRLTPSLSFGQELKGSHFYWLVGAAYGYASLDIFTSSDIGTGDSTSLSLNTEFGFRF